MAGCRDEADGGDGLNVGPVRQNLKATSAFGCVFAVLLPGGMSFAIFVGSIMGDCDPGPGCHDNDGIHILSGLAVALPIAASLSVGMWLLAAAIRAALRPIMGERPLFLLLTALTLALAWFAFGPAFELFFRWSAPGTS
jgi:hypothetical protein